MILNIKNQYTDNLENTLFLYRDLQMIEKHQTISNYTDEFI